MPQPSIYPSRQSLAPEPKQASAPHLREQYKKPPSPPNSIFFFLHLSIISSGLHWPYVNQYRSFIQCMTRWGLSVWDFARWVSFRSRLRRVIVLSFFQLPNYGLARDSFRKIRAPGAWAVEEARHSSFRKLCLYCEIMVGHLLSCRRAAEQGTSCSRGLYAEPWIRCAHLGSIFKYTMCIWLLLAMTYW